MLGSLSLQSASLSSPSASTCRCRRWCPYATLQLASTILVVVFVAIVAGVAVLADGTRHRRSRWWYAHAAWFGPSKGFSGAGAGTLDDEDDGAVGIPPRLTISWIEFNVGGALAGWHHRRTAIPAVRNSTKNALVFAELEISRVTNQIEGCWRYHRPPVRETGRVTGRHYGLVRSAV